MRIARAVILVGSAKTAGKSTSESLGRYLGDQLLAGGVTVEMLPVSRSLSADEGSRLSELVAGADLLVLASPLYVDSLPHLVTRALEGLAAARSERAPARRCAFVALVNSGFPESRQCQTALDIARAFANRTGFDWAGGLAVGGGGAIDGRPLEKLGGMTRGLRAALDGAAAAMLEGRPLPPEIVALAARPFVPAFLYTAMGDFGWRRLARRNGVGRQLGARPYAC